jgi:hypothetical protein
MLFAGLIAPPAAMAASVANGGFETGDFTDWTVVDQAGGSGSWFVYTGTSSPLNGFTVPAPPEGTFAAITDQGGPGSHLLYQDIVLEAGFTHTLSFILYLQNQGGAFATPETLDYTVFPNQQYRVDIVSPAAPPDSVASADVLAAVFRTEVGDPLTLGPTTVTFDLTPFAGTTVRLRFAEVDNQGFFQAGVDDVRVESSPTTPQTKDDCKNGGWRNYSDDEGQPFPNQGQCVRFVVQHD